MKRTVALLMENQSGALSRVVGLFSQRGYNIESLIVAATEDPSLSRLTMTTTGDEKVIEQITKQLNKLIDVVKVLDLGESDYVERELMLVKFANESITRETIKELNGETSYLNPILYIGSFAIGSIASVIDEKYNLGFLSFEWTR